jgi:hypothetical protein
MTKTLLLALLCSLPVAAQEAGDALTWVPIARSAGYNASQWTTNLTIANGSEGRVAVFMVDGQTGAQLGVTIVEVGQAGVVPDVVQTLALPDGVYVIRLVMRCLTGPCQLSNLSVSAVTSTGDSLGTPVRNLLILAGGPRAIGFTTTGRRRVYLWGPAGARAFDAAGLLLWATPADTNAEGAIASYPLPAEAAYVILDPPTWTPGHWPIAFGWTTETSTRNDSTLTQ